MNHSKNESVTTWSMVGVAVVFVILAIATAPGTPKSAEDFSDIGEAFYAGFEDPSKATSLQVATYDADDASVDLFQVDLKDGKWRIPSRYDYPADAKDRLGKTATALLGLKREALVGRNETQHAEFGVIDPFDEKVQDLQGRGNRITVRQGSELVADFIIGKQVPNRPGNFYLRRPDEKKVYTAKIDLDVSTRFTDWIEPDLLKLDSWKLREVVIDKYSIDLTRGRIVDKERSKLSRKTSGDQWALEPLNADKEEINQDEVRNLTTALDDLKIVGVRPKPVKLKQDLQLEKGIQLTEAVQLDLGERGFFFASTLQGDPRLVSKEGDLIASTEEGVVYELHFGDLFTGSEEDAEKGLLPKESTTAAPAEVAGDGKPAEAKPATDGKKNRYLLVTVSFDAELLGPKPAEPTKPTEPPKEDTPPATPPADGAAPAAPAVSPAQQEYLAALAQYEADLAKYPADLKAYEEKVAAGEKAVKELNARFADWYYVISAENFENLRQGRATLVKAKTPVAQPQGTAGSEGPDGADVEPGLDGAGLDMTDPTAIGAEDAASETTPDEASAEPAPEGELPVDAGQPANEPAPSDPATEAPATPEEPAPSASAPTEPATPAEPAAPAEPTASAEPSAPAPAAPGNESAPPATEPAPATP